MEGYRSRKSIAAIGQVADGKAVDETMEGEILGEEG